LDALLGESGCARFSARSGTTSGLSHDRPEWQAAVQALLLVVEYDGDTLLAYIGMKRALNAGRPTEPPELRRKRAKKHRII
jgi:hypothetical protein